MPFKVTGEDGRVLHDNLSDTDARDIARNVHQATGETVTLTPLRYSETHGEYRPAPDEAILIGAHTDEPEAEADPVEETEKPARPKRSKKKK